MHINLSYVNAHDSSYTIIDEADELVQGDWEGEISPLLSGGGELRPRQ